MHKKQLLLLTLIISSLFSSLLFAEVEPPDMIVYDGDTFIYAENCEGYKEGKDDFDYNKFRIDKDIDNDGKDESFFLVRMRYNDAQGWSRIFFFMYKDNEISNPLACKEYFLELGDPIEFTDVNEDGIQEIVVHTVRGNAAHYLQIFMFKEGEIEEIFNEASTTFGCIIDEESTSFKITVYGDRLEGAEMPDVQCYTREKHGHLYNKEIYEWRDDKFVKI